MYYKNLNFFVNYRSGTRMQHIVALSRAPVDSENDVEVSVDSELNKCCEVCVVLNAKENVRACQAADGKLFSLIEELNLYPKNYCRDYIIKYGILYRKYNNKLLLYTEEHAQKIGCRRA